MKNNTTKKDLVCGMDVISDKISTDYIGHHYVFCSEQCLERFTENPHLYIGYPGHEAPKHAGMEVIKTRTLKLETPLKTELINMLVKHIEAMMGIKSVDIIDGNIEITYDLLQVTESQIEETVIKTGGVLNEDFTEMLKRGFIHVMEETESDTMESRPDIRNDRH